MMENGLAENCKNDAVPLRDRAYEYLAERILTGALQPGAKIVETQTASEIGVSRTPLRDALGRLERDGFVQLDQGKGYSVRELTEREVRETYPIVVALELLALDESYAQLTISVDELVRINEQLLGAKDASEAVLLDTLWHDTLIKTCLNRRLLTLIEGFRRIIYRYERLYMSDKALIDVSVRQHKKIIDAIVEEDLDSVKSLVSKNYASGMNAVLGKIILE